MTFTETIAEGVLVDSLEVIRDEIAHDLSVCESMRRQGRAVPATRGRDGAA